MKKFAIAALVFWMFTGSVMAGQAQTVIACKTNDGNKFSVTWEPTSGVVVVNHGNYTGTKNTNDMGWNKARSSEAEDTEIYMDNGDIHNTISVTDTGTMKIVSFKQTVGQDPNNITVLDSCQDVVKLDVSDRFLENMIYIDEE